LLLSVKQAASFGRNLDDELLTDTIPYRTYCTTITVCVESVGTVLVANMQMKD